MNITNLKTFKANYERILSLIPGIENMRLGAAGKLTAAGFMDLHYDVLDCRLNRVDIALAHYYKQNGDSVPDPDMRIWLDLEKRMAYPMSFQNSITYRACIDENDRVRTQELQQQSVFLSQWLRNLKSQGHTVINNNAKQEL